MVQGGIGDHGVEARVGQLSRHDVGMQPADRRVGEPCLRTSQDGRIDVHCRDVGYAPSQPGSQQPVAAPDVEHALGTERHHGIQQSVVVDVGVPRLIHGDILLDGGVVVALARSYVGPKILFRQVIWYIFSWCNRTRERACRYTDTPPWRHALPRAY